MRTGTFFFFFLTMSKSKYVMFALCFFLFFFVAMLKIDSREERRCVRHTAGEDYGEGDNN